MTVLTFSPQVEWVRDHAQTLIIHPGQGQAYRLTGLDAAVWDWLALGYPYAQIIAFIAAAQALPLPEAEAALRARIADWLRQGLLEQGE